MILLTFIIHKDYELTSTELFFSQSIAIIRVNLNDKSKSLDLKDCIKYRALT
jgi:hypothetical protein